MVETKKKGDSLSMHWIANPGYGMPRVLYGFDMAGQMIANLDRRLGI
jgi:hypothetical protein